VLGCLAVPLAGADAATLYAAQGGGGGGTPSALFILDPATGAVLSTVGPIGFAVTGLAVHPITGDLYGSVARNSVASPGNLIIIDKTTGAGTLIGPFNVDDHSMADITFGSDGTLYGWAEPTIDALHTIDLGTGQATRVGTFEFPQNTFGSGLAFGLGGLIYTGRGGLGPISRVDPATGVAVTIATLNWPIAGFINALAFGPGGLYATAVVPFPNDLTSYLLRIEPFSGAVTGVGRTIDAADAIAFDPPSFPPAPLVTSIPTMSEVGFAVMAALLAAVALLRMRRRSARP
jgi:hypothetical protein